MESKSFYRNVFLLTQMVPPGKEFKKYFKEGMFDKPNTVGFIYISHYLLSTYDEERFKKSVDWPIPDKKDEGKYRNEVKDFMNAIAIENPDVELSQILPSHLHTASGTRFINLMWKLSTIVLRSTLKKQGAEPLNMAPKSGDEDILTKNLLTNIIADKKRDILELHKRSVSTETRAQTQATEMAKSIETGQSEWFEVKQRLEKTVAAATVHPDIKKRMADPNDVEIVQMWKENLGKALGYLRSQQDLLEKLTERSDKVAAVVDSVLNSDCNNLDANNLPRIDTQKLLELGNLDPDTQVAVHHLYEDNKLNLMNLLTIFQCLLKHLRVDIQKNSFPDFTDCNLQIQASTDDLSQMCELVSSFQSTVSLLASKMKPLENPVPKNHNLSFRLDSEVFQSVVLKSSPTIHLNANNEPERYDAAERLELTPVENVHKSLFMRYKNNETPSMPKPFKIRPKLVVSRINFDDSMSSTVSEKFSPVKRPVKPIGSTAKGKFSRLFSANLKKSIHNHSAVSPGHWKTNSNDSSIVGDVYNMSDLKPYLATKSSFNLSRELSAPMNSTPEKIVGQKQMLYVERPAFNSTEIVSELSTISENMEIRLTVGSSPNLQRMEKRENNRRISIGDLVEKYKKIREQSANVTYLEHSGDNSDDSAKSSISPGSPPIALQKAVTSCSAASLRLLDDKDAACSFIAIN
ncbi:uncharacterized protein dgt6 [Fopius arisanus]|uniref:Uncharacterized protein dgt6 n=1 Tax=Fopius arisanus TaxID=64838 RepID=A0A9R1TA30_9HYME|nr:PREDICTED: uncharacterized protein LOC105268049 [Fopius arisanus]